ncbi:hypothetical protein PV648_03585 [Streptomyces sp. ID05-47C]|nr:hypothetical protein [Streptomyces sp. ID05-47C]MDX3568412.1 hypothetical protein [Streptomyces sp. ID05-47C]
MIMSKHGGVDVAGHSDGPAFVGGVDDAVERLGGVFPHGQQADVVDDDEVRAADPGDGPYGEPVGLRRPGRGAE